MVFDMATLRVRALPILTKSAHISAPFITSFLLIHLSAPAIASLEGSSLASQTMLLGREYYQTALTEPLLVLLPLAVHPISALLKRLLSLLPPSKTPPRPKTSLLALTGYSLLLLAPIHFLTHRQYPTLDALPIDSLGPAELDYEFVKTGLREWPVRSWIMYGGLVGSVALHMVDGTALIWNAWMAGPRTGIQHDSPPAINERPSKSLSLFTFSSRTRIPRIFLALSAITLPVLAGLYTLSREPVLTFASMIGRHRAVFLESWIYRI